MTRTLKTMIVTFLATIGCASVMAGGETGAEKPDKGTMEPQSRPMQSFEQLDANGDGSISKREVPASSELGRNFDEADQDGDGALTREEFEKHAGKQAGSDLFG